MKPLVFLRAVGVCVGLVKDCQDKPHGYHLLGTIRQKDGDDPAALADCRAALDPRMFHYLSPSSRG